MELVGYLGMPFVIAFLIVHYAIGSSYKKKHNKPMSGGAEFGITAGIGFCLLVLALIGRLGSMM